MITNLIITMVLAAVITGVATPLVIKLFVSRGWVEDPKEKQKKTGNATAIGIVPRGGGLAVFGGILIPTLIFLPLDKHLIGIILAAVVTVAVGVWDDVKDISPKLRLVTNLLAALIVVGCGIGVGYLSNPMGGVIDLSQPQIVFELWGQHSIWILSDLLAIGWILACMNIVGWSAGVEGQMPGFVSITALFIGILGLRYSGDRSEWPVIILAGAVSGAYLGFWPWNFFPQKIMPGYSGKSLAGLMLAILAILSGAKVATMMILLGIPIVDAAWVLLKRVATGRSPLQGGGDHLHHQLLKMGWGRRRIAVFYAGVSLVLGAVTLFLNSWQKLVLFGVVVVFFGLVLLKVYWHTWRKSNQFCHSQG